MFGKDPRVNPLDTRKRLLIAESELNRAQLTQEWGALTGSVRTFADRARSLGSIATSAAALVAGLTNLRSNKPAEAEAKPSWMKSILKGAGLISTFWLAFRPRDHDQDSK